MNGEQNLKQILSMLDPVLIPGEFVFVTFASAKYGDHEELRPVATMMEAEGLTLVIPMQQAVAHRITCESPVRCISLNVHTSLDAIGLTAAFSEKLATKAISANVIAGYFHDHIFVPTADAEKAIATIKDLAR